MSACIPPIGGGFVWFYSCMDRRQSEGHYLLFLFGLFELIGIAFLSFSGSLVPVCIGAALLGFGSAALFLFSAAILAGGRGGSEMFVVAWGFSSHSKFSSHNLLRHCCRLFPFTVRFGTECVPGARYSYRTRFDSTYSGQERTIHNASATAGIFPESCQPYADRGCIPMPDSGLFILLAVQDSREVRQFSPSNTLLSPRAAVWCSLFIPFFNPVMMLTLTDVLNTYCQEKKSINGSRLRE